MGKCQRVLIMAGGTGGHVFPGLAVAKRLRQEGIDVQWLGTQTGLEARLVMEANIPIYFISISGLRGKGWKSLILAPWRLLKAIYQSSKILHQLKPDVVLGMGGFVSGPGGIASWMLRYPLVIHEQNAKPGLTNRWLAKIAHKVLEGFPHTFARRHNVMTTGNPVREEIIKGCHPGRSEGSLAVKEPSCFVRNANDHDSSLHLLVLGGSLGAAAMNHLVPKTLAALSDSMQLKVLHQTGEKHLSDTQKAYADAGVSADIQPFITAIDKAYQWADIVLCRAGALTIAELCAAGRGAILVPYPYAVDNHQTANANYMVENNAALLIQQRSLTAEVLAEILKELYATREKCDGMAQAAYRLRKIDATEKVLTICREIAE